MLSSLGISHHILTLDAQSFADLSDGRKQDLIIAALNRFGKDILQTADLLTRVDHEVWNCASHNFMSPIVDNCRSGQVNVVDINLLDQAEDEDVLVGRIA